MHFQKKIYSEYERHSSHSQCACTFNSAQKLQRWSLCSFFLNIVSISIKIESRLFDSVSEIRYIFSIKSSDIFWNCAKSFLVFEPYQCACCNFRSVFCMQFIEIQKFVYGLKSFHFKMWATKEHEKDHLVRNFISKNFTQMANYYHH